MIKIILFIANNYQWRIKTYLTNNNFYNNKCNDIVIILSIIRPDFKNNKTFKNILVIYLSIYDLCIESL
jgi:hypothetical protein